MTYSRIFRLFEHIGEALNNNVENEELKFELVKVLGTLEDFTEYLIDEKIILDNIRTLMEKKS